MPFFPPLEDMLNEFALQKQGQFDIAAAYYTPPKHNTMVGLGVGFRTVNVDADIREYLEAELGENMSAEVPLAGDVTFPYITLVVRTAFAQKSPVFRERAFIEMEGQWMSSMIIGERSGSEKVPVQYSDVEVGDATTDWSFYFGNYYSFGTRLVYVTNTIHFGAFVLRPELSGTIGFSYLQNKVDLSMDITEAKLVQTIGAETLEDEFGVYATSKTVLELRGMGTYVAPGAGIMLSRGRLSARVRVGYRVEEIPITVKEKTVYGDGEEVTRNEQEVKMNTSGMEGTAIISYAF